MRGVFGNYPGDTGILDAEPGNAAAMKMVRKSSSSTDHC